MSTKLQPQLVDLDGSLMQIRLENSVIRVFDIV